jgi:hypothetical protein
MKTRDNMRIIMVALLLLCSIVAQGQLPTISSFNPKRGGVGTTISITGSNFGTDPGALTVRFGAVTSPVLTTTGSTLTVKVPAGASYERVSVTANGLTAWTREFFLPTFEGTGVLDANTFAEQVDFVEGSFPQFVDDVDGDGKPDLITLSQTEIRWSRNVSTPGNLSFVNIPAQSEVITFPNVPNQNNRILLSMKLADMNGDGRNDIVRLHGLTGTNWVHWFLTINTNVGTGGSGGNAYSAAQVIPVGSHEFDLSNYHGFPTIVGSVDIGDINMNGKPDVIIGVNMSTMITSGPYATTCSSGCGTDFTYESSFCTYQKRLHVVQDVALEGSLYTYAANNNVATGAYAFDGYVTLANMGTDARPDLFNTRLYGYHYNDSQCRGPATIRRNNTQTGGTTQFVTNHQFLLNEINSLSISGSSRVGVADFDLDGKNDLYTENFVLPNQYATGAQDPVFTSSALVTNTSTAIGVAPFGTVSCSTCQIDYQGIVGDVTGNGMPDHALLTSDANFVVTPNNHVSGALSANSFGTSRNYPIFGSPTIPQLRWAVKDWYHCHDMDLDGKPDLIFAAGQGFSIMRNQTPTTGAVVTIGAAPGGIGSTVSVPVTATGLNNIEGFQFSIAYDPGKLSFQGVSNWAAGVNASSVIVNNDQNAGQLSVVYNDNAFSVSNGNFFNLDFNVIASSTGTTSLAWSDSPTPREFVNSVPNIINVSYVNGAVNIENSLFNISGSVTYDNTTGTPMNGVALELVNSSNVVVASTTTEITGSYVFTGVANGSYTVRPSTTKAWGGVSSIDITLYKRHIGNVPGFILQGIRLGSGDVNVSTTLTSIDLTIIKRRIGAQISSFASGDWLFEDGSITVSGGNVSRNIKAICYGDANGSYTPPQ